MILTVTLNACIDKTYTVPFFTLDRVHRPDQMLVTPGGKGINVARVYQTLGGEAVATGFLGGSNGEYLAKSLHRDGIRDAFVRVREESRVCLQIADPVAGTMTELNEHGPTIMPDDAGALLLALEDRLPGCEMLVISGSMPPETPTGLYAQMIALAQNEFGVRAVLDTSGDPLAAGLEARPFLAKPNRRELAAIGLDADSAAEASLRLRSEYGLPWALVTDGPAGAALAGSDGLWTAAPPPVEIVSAVGSGDSLTAAFVHAFLRTGDPAEALRWGVAAGTANAMTYGAGKFRRADLDALLPQISVTQAA